MNNTPNKLEYGKLLREATDLTHAEYRVLSLLVSYTDGDLQNAWPGNARLAENAAMSVRYCQEVLKSLLKKGYLCVAHPGGNQYGWHRATAYVITVPEQLGGTGKGGLRFQVKDEPQRGGRTIDDGKGEPQTQTRVMPDSSHHVSDQLNTSAPSEAHPTVRASRGALNGTPREQLKACQTLGDLVAFRHRFPDREGSPIGAEAYSEQRSQVIRRTVADEMQRLETPEDIRDFRERYYDLIRYSSELRDATDERAGEIFDANADKYLYDLQACDDLDSLEDFGDRFDYIPREEFITPYRDRTNAVVARVAASILATLHTPAEISEFESQHHLLHNNRAWDAAQRNRRAELAVMS